MKDTVDDKILEVEVNDLQTSEPPSEPEGHENREVDQKILFSEVTDPCHISGLHRLSNMTLGVMLGTVKEDLDGEKVECWDESIKPTNAAEQESMAKSRILTQQELSGYVIPSQEQYREWISSGDYIVLMACKGNMPIGSLILQKGQEYHSIKHIHVSFFNIGEGVGAGLLDEAVKLVGDDIPIQCKLVMNMGRSSQLASVFHNHAFQEAGHPTWVRFEYQPHTSSTNQIENKHDTADKTVIKSMKIQLLKRPSALEKKQKEEQAQLAATPKPKDAPVISGGQSNTTTLEKIVHEVTRFIRRVSGSIESPFAQKKDE